MHARSSSPSPSLRGYINWRSEICVVAFSCLALSISFVSSVLKPFGPPEKALTQRAQRTRRHRHTDLRCRIAQDAQQPLRKIRDNSIHARRNQPPHLLRLINRPGHHLQTRLMGLLNHGWRERSPRATSCRAPARTVRSTRSLDGCSHKSPVIIVESSRWTDSSVAGSNERITTRAEAFSVAQRRDHCVLDSPCRSGFYFQIKNDVVLFRKIEDFLQRGHALPGKRRVPRPPNHDPASRARICSSVSQCTWPLPFVVRSSVKSWMAMTCASRVICRSVSIKRAPSSTARRNAAIVFSGACPEAPRCAIDPDSLRSHFHFHHRQNANDLAPFAILPDRPAATQECSNAVVPRMLFEAIAHLSKCRVVRNRRPAMAGERRTSMGTRASLQKYVLCSAFGGVAELYVRELPRQTRAVLQLRMFRRFTNQVQHKLAMLPWYGVFDNLGYQVNGTEVILSGQVISEHATTKDDAGKFVSIDSRRDKSRQQHRGVAAIHVRRSDSPRRISRRLFAGRPGPVHDGRHSAGPYHREKWTCRLSKAWS